MKLSRRAYAVTPSYDITGADIQCRADGLTAKVFEIQLPGWIRPLLVLTHDKETAAEAGWAMSYEQCAAYGLLDGVSDSIVDDGEIIECWCGEKGTFDQLYDTVAGGCGGCGGLGSVECHCGGDICACHNHGEIECPGCPDCEPESDFDGVDMEEDFR